MNTKTTPAALTKESFFGKKLVSFNIKYTLSKGYEITSHEALVYDPAVNKQIVPCAGCDMIIHGSSTNSSLIFELGKDDGYSDTLRAWQRINRHGYCLPENFDKVKAETIDFFKDAIKNYMDTMYDMLEDMERSVSVKPKEVETQGVVYLKSGGK